MTWVVAHASPAAVAVIGDVRITIATPLGAEELEDVGVKKVHHIMPNIVVGFAGNIAVGFRMVEELRHFYSWRPTFTGALNLAEEWCDYMKLRYWELLPPHLRGQPTHLIVAGFHPSPVSEADPQPIPIGVGLIVECPTREGEPPEITRKFGAMDPAVSIGSGSGVDEYKRLLNEFDWLQAAQFPDPQLAMAAVVQWTIERQPTLGVSKDVIGHVLIGRRDGFGAQVIALGDHAQTGRVSLSRPMNYVCYLSAGRAARPWLTCWDGPLNPLSRSPSNAQALNGISAGG